MFSLKIGFIFFAILEKELEAQLIFPEDLIPIFWNIFEDKKLLQKWYRGPKGDTTKVYRWSMLINQTRQA